MYTYTKRRPRGIIILMEFRPPTSFKLIRIKNPPKRCNLIGLRVEDIVLLKNNINLFSPKDRRDEVFDSKTSGK